MWHIFRLTRQHKNLQEAAAKVGVKGNLPFGAQQPFEAAQEAYMRFEVSRNPILSWVPFTASFYLRVECAKKIAAAQQKIEQAMSWKQKIGEPYPAIENPYNHAQLPPQKKLRFAGRHCLSADDIRGFSAPVYKSPVKGKTQDDMAIPCSQRLVI